MAAYDYKCNDCGHEFEQLLSIGEHDKFKARCPECKSKKVQQVLSDFFAKTESKT